MRKPTFKRKELNNKLNWKTAKQACGSRLCSVCGSRTEAMLGGRNS